jgi:hypothetical protein
MLVSSLICIRVHSCRHQALEQYGRGTDQILSPRVSNPGLVFGRLGDPIGMPAHLAVRQLAQLVVGAGGASSRRAGTLESGFEKQGLPCPASRPPALLPSCRQSMRPVRNSQSLGCAYPEQCSQTFLSGRSGEHASGLQPLGHVNSRKSTLQPDLTRNHSTSLTLRT